MLRRFAARASKYPPSTCAHHLFAVWQENRSYRRRSACCWRRGDGDRRPHARPPRDAHGAGPRARSRQVREAEAVYLGLARQRRSTFRAGRVTRTTHAPSPTPRARPAEVPPHEPPGGSARLLTRRARNDVSLIRRVLTYKGPAAHDPRRRAAHGDSPRRTPNRRLPWANHLVAARDGIERARERPPATTREGSAFRGAPDDVDLGSACTIVLDAWEGSAASSTIRYGERRVRSDGALKVRRHRQEVAARRAVSCRMPHCTPIVAARGSRLARSLRWGGEGLGVVSSSAPSRHACASDCALREDILFNS